MKQIDSTKKNKPTTVVRKKKTVAQRVADWVAKNHPESIVQDDKPAIAKKVAVKKVVAEKVKTKPVIVKIVANNTGAKESDIINLKPVKETKPPVKKVVATKTVKEKESPINQRKLEKHLKEFALRNMTEVAKDEKPKKKKTFHYTGRGNPYDKLVRLANDGRTFTHTHTTATTKIVIDNGTSFSNHWYGGRDYTYKEFHLQRKLKKEIRENIKLHHIRVPKLTQSDISYMVYSDQIKDMGVGEFIDDVQGFDINKAYYQCAHEIKYMGEKLYDQCIHLPKHVRLRFIGTIATSKHTFHRKGWKIIGKVKIKQDKLLRRVWFHICKRVDDCLKEFMSMIGDRFLLYYVDGIYVKKGDYTAELDYLKKKYGFDFKSERVKMIVRRHREQYDSHGIDIWKWDDKKWDFLPKEFTFRKDNKYATKNLQKLMDKNGLLLNQISLKDVERKLLSK